MHGTVAKSLAENGDLVGRPGRAGMPIPQWVRPSRARPHFGFAFLNLAAGAGLEVC